MKLYDLSQPAPNGMRRGRTTGSCATAATKAALQALRGDIPTQVLISLPDGEYRLEVPIERVDTGTGWATGFVVKDGGDDPDATHGLTVWAKVTPTDGPVRFLAGEGVGTVTAPGLQIPVGEAAINPVPRRMMLQAVQEVTGQQHGFDIEVGVLGGVEVGRKTFNPRIGVLGGISILGTTGIVEPMSLEAYQASIDVYVRVALGERPDVVVLTPGKLGRDWARQLPELSERQIVQMSNFVGYALDCVESVLQEQNGTLRELVLAGHPGKLAKVLMNEWDTHSHRSGMAMPALADIAAADPRWAGWAQAMREANTVEQICTEYPQPDFWDEVTRQIETTMHRRVPHVQKLTVRLFAMDGTPLFSPSLVGRAAG